MSACGGVGRRHEEPLEIWCDASMQTRVLDGGERKRQSPLVGGEPFAGLAQSSCNLIKLSNVGELSRSEHAELG